MLLLINIKKEKRKIKTKKQYLSFQSKRRKKLICLNKFYFKKYAKKI